MTASTLSAAGKRRRVTENLLLDALETVLVRDGLRQLTVNAVIDQAGVGKPLLYRYFDGLPGLVTAWAERRGFAAPQLETPGTGQAGPGVHADTGSPDDFLVAVADQLVGNADHLRGQPVMLEMLAEELTADSDLSAAFAQARRSISEPFLRAMLTDERYTDPLVRGRIIVLYAAVTYLAMRAQRAPLFMGLRLDTEAGWKEAMTMVASLATGRAPGDHL